MNRHVLLYARLLSRIAPSWTAAISSRPPLPPQPRRELGHSCPQPSSKRQPDLIKTENAKSGESFQLTRMMPDNAKSYRTSLIEGYCSRQSIKAGEKLDIFVSTKPTAKFTIDIFRMGYYDGAGSRLMTTLGPFDGKDAARARDGRQTTARMSVGSLHTLTIPADWPSGVYLGRLTTVPEGCRQTLLAELHHLHRQRRPPCRHPLPMQRQHLAGVQSLAGERVALHRSPRRACAGRQLQL
jgi:hypothetical protein